MLQKIACVILTSFAWFQLSVGQTTFFKNDNPFSFGVSRSDSGAFASSFLQDFSPSVPLNEEKNYQIPTESSTSLFQAPFLSSGPSLTVSSTYQISPVSNLSPVESFITELNSAVYSSKILPNIFDLTELTPEAFSISMYNYVYGNGLDVTHSDPHYVASMVATPLKEAVDTYTLPVTLAIYGKAIGKYLFAKGTLNSFNASSLAKKYAKLMEYHAERKWAKDTPESKFLVLEDGFVDYMKSIAHFSENTIEDLAVYFSNAVKEIATKP